MCCATSCECLASVDCILESMPVVFLWLDTSFNTITLFKDTSKLAYYCTCFSSSDNLVCSRFFFIRFSFLGYFSYSCSLRWYQPHSVSKVTSCLSHMICDGVTGIIFTLWTI